MGRIDTLGGRVVAGDRAIRAVVGGNAVDPVEVEKAADAMDELLAGPQLTGPDWTAADVARLRQL